MSSKNPSVSVVMAAYQHARFVKRAVRSVLEQSIDDLELIAVDDGSTDGTPDIIAGIDDDRINLVRLGENRLENPRNVALEYCKGEYIAFQNSDDEWQTEKLECQLREFEQHPETGAVFTKVQVIDADGNPDSNHPLNKKFCQHNRSSAEWLREFFFHGNCLCITSAIVRKSCLDKVGEFRPSLVQVADLDLWIRIAAIAEIYIVNQPLTRMRVIGHNNLSLNPDHRYRLVHEMAQAFERYGEPLLLKRLSEIFPAISKNIPNNDPVLCFAALARYASNLDGRSHRLFADRALSRLIDDPKQRKLIVNAFGAEFFRSFLARRLELAIEIKHHK